tara:strand:+ start:553 stop:1281 length:729 start_codon:yes stop_codon:yes gene_type:complete
MTYFIAIPSYNRLQILQNKTLAFLRKHNIDESKIFLFVHPDSYQDYLLLKDNYPDIHIIESRAGIKNSRNFITKFFNNGQRIVSIDDDVKDLINLNTNQPILDLKDFIDDSFNMTKDGIWGVSALDNAFFSTCRDKFGLSSIVSTFCGYTNIKSIHLELDVMEDFERVIKFHNLGRTILKRGWVGIKTTYWTTRGGLQSILNKDERIDKQNYSAEILLGLYPDLCYIRTRKSGLKDIRFKKI